MLLIEIEPLIEQEWYLACKTLLSFIF